MKYFINDFSVAPNKEFNFEINSAGQFRVYLLVNYDSIPKNSPLAFRFCFSRKLSFCFWGTRIFL